MLSDGFLTWLRKQEDETRKQLVALMDEPLREMLMHDWPLWARREQRAPQAEWSCWLICAGRGFGKTRAGAEWVRTIATLDRRARIALVGGSLHEARAVMVEGESGLLNICPPAYRPVYEPSLKRLTWPSGAMAFLYSAGEPESLRGPQHSHAWCDEIGKWDAQSGRAEAAWDNLLMGLRLGLDPQIVATTTPRPTALMRRLLGEAQSGQVHVTGGSTYDNAPHLPARFVAAMRRNYGASALGRKELDGVLLEDIEGALWTRSLIERCRDDGLAPGLELCRTVVGVDPPASERGDACGIVVCALDAEGIGHVLADRSVALAHGANRLLVGSEIVQFAQARPLDEMRWQLTGLLRGRGGTEAAALAGHAAGTQAVLLDDRLVPLPPGDLALVGDGTLAAIGAGDAEAAVAHIEQEGRSRQPPVTVHPRHAEASGGLELSWTRRARGGWTWLDAVEQPLVEQVESYEVGLGPVAAPLRLWRTAVPQLLIAAAEREVLAAAYPGVVFWVRQAGSYARSDALSLECSP